MRKVRTRKDEWERKKMGVEFMSDARTPEEDAAPRGFVRLLSQSPASGRPSRCSCCRRMSGPFAAHASCDPARSSIVPH